MEILAACGREVKTVGISDWSFTSRLTEILHHSKDRPFTVAQLHSRLVNYRAAEGPKKLLKTPVHGIVSDNDKASIRLSTMALASDLTSANSDDLSASEGSGTDRPVLPVGRVLIAVSLRSRELTVTPGANGFSAICQATLKASL